LNCCSQKITAEHFISHAALRVLAEKKIDVSGFPWMQEGESRSVSFESLTVKRLCAAHNNALSPLDAVAGIFFTRSRNVARILWGHRESIFSPGMISIVGS
jgi:hypothetical protein